MTLPPISFYHEPASKKMIIITLNEDNNNHPDLKRTSHSQ
jgi:hypothetical protein